MKLNKTVLICSIIVALSASVFLFVATADNVSSKEKAKKEKYAMKKTEFIELKNKVKALSKKANPENKTNKNYLKLKIA